MATQKMLKFVTVGREMPEKRDAASRSEDFHEIYREFADAKAKEQGLDRIDLYDPAWLSLTEGLAAQLSPTAAGEKS